MTPIVILGFNFFVAKLNVVTHAKFKPQIITIPNCASSATNSIKIPVCFESMIKSVLCWSHQFVEDHLLLNDFRVILVHSFVLAQAQYYEQSLSYNFTPNQSHLK